MSIDLQSHDTIPGCEWVIDLEVEPPQRLVKIEFDTNTLISLVDIADAAAISGGEHTSQNARIFTEYFLRVIRELETRSLIDHAQWSATEHLAAAE